MEPAGFLNPKRLLRESRLYPVLDSWRTRFDRQRSRARFQRHLRPSDLFLVGHPKSGNTWLAYMLAVLRDRDLEDGITLANVTARVPAVHGAEARIAQHAALPEPRIFRNEWPVSPDLYPRSVYLVRDPRAALVSMFHMYRVLYPRDRIEMAEFVDEYLAHGCIRRWEPRLVRWDRQVEAWRARRERGARVLVVRFEDMVADRARALREAAAFAGIHASAPVFEHAVARGSFAAMRADEEAHGAAAYPGRKRERGRFIRRGEPDSWRDEMAPQLAARIERAFAPGMRALGYLE